MRTKTDAELIAAYVSSKDEEVFAEIVSRHGPMVYRVCLGMLGDPHEAEDASQATFIVLTRKAQSLKRRRELSAWLYGVARNVCLQAIRRRAQRAKGEKRVAMMKEAGMRQDDSEQARQELLGSLYLELGLLSKVQRQAVLLRHIEGHSEKEAAAIVGCAPNTLSKRVKDGLERLRQRLCSKGHILGAAMLLGVLQSETQAAVPQTLFSSILTASTSAAASAAAGTAGLTNAAILAKGAMKMMFLAKVKMATAVIAAACILGTGTGLVLGQTLGKEKDTAGKEKVAEAIQKTDAAKRKKQTGIKVSKAAVVKGLSVTVMPTKAVFGKNEALTFDVTFKNVSEKGFMLYDVAHYYPWDYSIEDSRKVKWKARCIVEFERAAPIPSVVVEPGKSHVVKASLDNSFRFVREDGKEPYPNHLPPGKYRLTITAKLFKDRQSHLKDYRFGFWTGSITTKPVKFKIR